MKKVFLIPSNEKESYLLSSLKEKYVFRSQRFYKEFDPKECKIHLFGHFIQVHKSIIEWLKHNRVSWFVVKENEKSKFYLEIEPYTMTQLIRPIPQDAL